jgi:hypothetical protein
VAQIVAATAFLTIGLCAVPALSTPAGAGNAIANPTFYWNGATGDACAYCNITVIVQAWPNSSPPPTDNSGITFASGTYVCDYCVQWMAPGADNAFGYYFAQMSWVNATGVNWGEPGFLLGFTNQT